MRRILAIVCIFILLLFTGMPMFTSNLLCNQTEVYADEPPNISDNEKIRAAITVYLNSKGAYLSSNGLTMDAVMGCMQENIDHFYPAYSLILGSAYDAASLVLDIGVSTSPLTIILKAGAVRFFNAFLQWLIDEDKITNTPNGSDGLYSGIYAGHSLCYMYKVNTTSPSTRYETIPDDEVLAGTDVGEYNTQYLENKIYAVSPDFSLTSTSSQTNQFSGYFTVDYLTGISKTYEVSTSSYSTGTYSDYTPKIKLSSPTINWSSTIARNVGSIVNCSRVNNVKGKPAFICIQYKDSSNQNNYLNKIYTGWVSHDYTAGKYYLWCDTEVNRNDHPVGNANVDFNKDDFDPSPTTPPNGSDGLTYQPRQTGTGNTYNNYNDYYQDWHEGDTYIYNPGSGGGGSGGDDPGSGGGGSGGDDPGSGGGGSGGSSDGVAPGGTQPPWDGNSSDGLYSTGMTLTPDGNGGYNVNFPDVGLPNLNIDWSINGLKEKFPFSIPWDLMAFFAVMNAEPETPYIKADIPLGLWEWNIDWDLHAFDNVARILRNMELIGFCIGLILITRSIIKG